jgi:ubiquinone/menaquinone biosynthesis C-methylase UbiE
VNEEIAILKEPKRSRHEFVWKVQFPDIKKYDKIRRQYAAYLSEGLINADELLLDEMVKKSPKRGIVLDLASGMGTLLLALSKQHGRIHVMGTDVDETPLRGAMLKLIQQESDEQVSLCVMDAKHLAVKTEQMPCVVSYFGFNNVPQTKQALSETFRVMTPNGRLAFATLSLEEGSRSFKEAAKLGYGDVATEARLIRTLKETGFRVDSIERFYSGEWLHNPMDRLPREGDWFAHSLVLARKR